MLNILTFANAASLVESVSATQSQSSIAQVLPIFIILIVFYFFIIRPQSKKYKDQQSMANETKIGDEVILSCGFFGKIDSINEKEEVCEIKISDNSVVKMYKTSIVKNISLNDRLSKVKIEKVKK